MLFDLEVLTFKWFESLLPSPWGPEHEPRFLAGLIKVIIKSEPVT
jgi:hypothetical protein